MKLLLETLKAGTGYLEKRGIEEARLNMEHLLAHVLQCRRLELYLRFGEVLREGDLETLRGLLKRRGDGEPLQHLLGSVEFCGNELVCDHRALVPRPETERLVELIIGRFCDQPPASVLDVGTGSGCIGLSLAKAWQGRLPPPAKDEEARRRRDDEFQKSADVETEANVDRGESDTARAPRMNHGFTLIDISEDALELARLNASRLGLDGVPVRFLRSDLFEKVDGRFDLIVANLPYIPAAEIPALSREVLRDPMLALDGGSTGLEIIARMLEVCGAHLSPGGVIALEIGHDQAPAVISLCKGAGLLESASAADLAGVERFVFAKTSLE